MRSGPDARRGSSQSRRQASRQMARPMGEPRGLAVRGDAVRGNSSWRGRVSSAVALATGAALVLAVVFGIAGLFGRPGPAAQPRDEAAIATPSDDVSAGGQATPTTAITPSQAPGSDAPTAATATPPPSAGALPTAHPSPSPTVAPTPTRNPSAAPRNASEFDLAGQAIAILFPLGPDAHYWYRDNFMRRRDGDPVAHNHARVAGDGKMVRLHDGIDIYGPAGEPVLAPFSGRVIDPSTRWHPWSSERYGVTVVVISDEPLTDGYAAVMVHLDRARVSVGDHVERGELVGRLGVSGNADGDGIHPHLHFELRAPFTLDWLEAGVERHVDAFNAFPSLVRADPQR